MTFPDMQFDIQEIHEKLKPIIKIHKCPVCGYNHFILHTSFAPIFLCSDYKNIDLTSHYPAAILTCKRCSHIDLFSIIDLYRKDDKNG